MYVALVLSLTPISILNKIMTDKFFPSDIKQLFHFISSGLKQGRIFGIPRELFFTPAKNDPFQTERYNTILSTPIGVAAGPHTQLAQNIISAWLCGARYIELKTIQTLDELEISKPCIDMQDEGYNCEWSQELKIEQSFREYLRAWILIHILKEKMEWNTPLGTIFNMSIGYDLAGIKNENVQWFMNKMKDASAELSEEIAFLRNLMPEIGNIEIPSCISDNVTLSTMHGCPPHEIEKIGLYLIEEKKLNTTIKLNPTLLGPVALRKILNETLGFTTAVPDIAFEHDLKYDDALKIIRSLTDAAEKNNVKFSIKLTNTLESLNIRNVFDKSVDMMYMSGRALHPVAINLAKKLQNEFKGTLDISFSAGADCFNISDILACNLKPVTICSDILKPGGYGRLSQYMENIKNQFHKAGAKSIEQYISKKDGTAGLTIAEAALLNLNKYANDVLESKQYINEPFNFKNIKTNRQLNQLDCISAPCVSTCPTHQDIPEYLYSSAKGDFDTAFRTIIRTNPLPSILGMACDHQCQAKCTRINYDKELAIRAVKRFATQQSSEKIVLEKTKSVGKRVAIIGAGPSGLSCAHFLALSGFEVEIFETKSFSGGMVADAIPSFRISREAINKDIARIQSLGVKINYNTSVNKEIFQQLQKDFEYIYIAVGAQKARRLKLEGEDAINILDPLKFLSDIKQGVNFDLGVKVAVVGGGNTAIDVARTAKRLNIYSDVTLYYRRTRKEMPADIEEVKAALHEGILIEELVTPVGITVDGNKATSFRAARIKLSEADDSGRAKPEIIDGSEHDIEVDTLIPALGQEVVMSFTTESWKTVKEGTYETESGNIFLGGDALHGASTIIRAVADGRFVAKSIIDKEVTVSEKTNLQLVKDISFNDLLVKRSRRIESKFTAPADKMKFETSDFTMDAESAAIEASRCLYCDELCSICDTVCPNRANYTYRVKPVSWELQKAVKNNNKIDIIADQLFEIKQSYQVLNIGDYCNECGNCSTFCPTSGSPFKDKPRLFLSFSSFNECGNGYFITRMGSTETIMFRKQNEIKTLTSAGDILLFDTNKLVARIDKKDFSLLDVKFKDNNLSEATFEDAALMSILLESAKDISYTEQVI